MNENHRLIKDVSNALNYYIERTRREECFDLSGVLRPAYDLKQFKFNKLFGYSTAYDDTIKKILKPDIRIPRATKKESEEIKLREQFYRDELKYHLKWDRKKKLENKPFAAYGTTNTNNNNNNTNLVDTKHVRSKSSHEKLVPSIPVGLITLRNTHTPTLTKREKLSMLNITSKIMSASEDILIMKKLADEKSKNRLTCYARKSMMQSKKNEIERRQIERRRLEQQRREQEVEEHEDQGNKYDEFDSIHSSSSSSSDFKNKRSSDVENEGAKLDRERQEMKRQEEEKAAAELEKIKLKMKQEQMESKQRQENLDDLKEIKSGNEIKYRVIIRTSDKPGASTDALIRLRLYGTKGKSKLFELKDSKTHRIPFRKGNTDVFDLSIYDIGKIVAISIGHREKEIEYNWYMDHLKIEDYENNITYYFENNDWFSEVNSRDGQTTRVLYKKPAQTTDTIDETESFSSSGSSVSISGSSSPSRSSARSKPKDQSSRSSKKSSRRTSIHSTTEEKQASRSSSRSRSKKSSSFSQHSKRSGSDKAKPDDSVSPDRSEHSPVIFKEAPKEKSISARSPSVKSDKKSLLESESSSSLSSTSSSTSLSSTSSSSSYQTRSSYSGSIRKKSKDSQQKKDEQDDEENTEDKASSNQNQPTDSINQNKDIQMSTKSFNSKHSTSSSVREAEEEITEITSRKFTISPSPPSTPKKSQSDFSVRAVSSTKLKMNIFESVETNQIDVLKDLIQKSPLDIRKIDSSGRTLMIIACEKGYEQIVKYLADNNDELLRIDTPLGLFPVHMCAQFNHLNCLNILYEYGASLQSKTNDGQTPLHLAAQCGNMDIVKWLVEHNINVNIYDNKKETAYDLAKKYQHYDIANYLAEPSGKPIITVELEESKTSRHSSARKSSARSDKSTPLVQAPDISKSPTLSKKSAKSNKSKHSKHSSRMSSRSSSLSSTSDSSTTSSSEFDPEEEAKNLKAKSASTSKSSRNKSLLTSENSSLTSVRKNSTQTATSPSTQHQSNTTIKQLIESNLNQEDKLKQENDSDKEKNSRPKSSRSRSNSAQSILLKDETNNKSVLNDGNNNNKTISSSSELDSDEEKIVKPKSRSSKHSDDKKQNSRSSLLKSPSNNLVDRNLNASKTSRNATPVTSTPFSPSNNKDRSLNNSPNDRDDNERRMSSTKLKTPTFDESKRNSLSPIVPKDSASHSRKASTASQKQQQVILNDEKVRSKPSTPSKTPEKSIEKLTYSRTSIHNNSSSSSESESDREMKKTGSLLNKTNHVEDSDSDSLRNKKSTSKPNSKPASPSKLSKENNSLKSFRKTQSDSESDDEKKRDKKPESRTSMTKMNSTTSATKLDSDINKQDKTSIKSTSSINKEKQTQENRRNYDDLFD